METKVSTEILRRMKPGETKVFDLPNARAIYTGKTLAYRLQPVLMCKFSTSADFVNNQLTITKAPMT